MDILDIIPRPFNRLENIGLYNTLLAFITKENAGIDPKYLLMEVKDNKMLNVDSYKTHSGKKLIAIWVTKDNMIIIQFKEKGIHTYYHADIEKREFKQFEINN